ncbi:beta strand repeat-containing protein [Haloferula rosea]|uniref:Autotransporter-associated beta strand repeat-containing protein n=1 Tax=Haloferula rosea TaxID=490093 RepID=A0A934R996_9BACT|nr:autotransporter-associated beta strand repeat-containing protein [Haloferula rosea]MBK1825553.1 autotransporter-associated beta strand repeat-containing protein [Haloferula rosea]
MKKHQTPQTQSSLFGSVRSSIVLLGLLTPVIATAADGTWIGGNINGNWSDTANWQDGIVGDGAASVVSVTADYIGTGGAAKSVTIDTTSRTVGVLTIGDTDPGTAGKMQIFGDGATDLTFDNSGSGAVVTNIGGVNNGLVLPMFLLDDLTLNNNADTLMVLADDISAGDAGSYTITNAGTGTAELRVGTGIADGGGTVAFTQNSATSNTAFFNSVNTYTGLTTISAGSLSVEEGGTLGMGDTLNDSALLFNRSGGEYTYAGAISGIGTVTQSGAGTVTLSGASTYTGATSITSGTLDITGSLTSDVTVGADATLSGEGSTTGAVTLENAGVLSVDPLTAGAFSTTGTLTTNATTLIALESLPADSNPFTLINYGTYVGSVTDFFTENYRTSGVVDDSANNRLTLAIDVQSSNWTGGDALVPTFWDVGNGENWSSSDSLYYDADSVTFGDTAAGLVEVQFPVAPNTVTFANTNGNNYTIDDVTAGSETITTTSGGINVTGGGDVTMNIKLTGNTDITHSGTGTLSLGGGGAVNNDFIGTITVDGGGTLKNLRNTDNINSLGDFGNTFSFTNGSTFDLNSIANHRDYQNYGAGSFFFGDGTTISNSGNTSNDAFGDQLVFGGDVTFDGTGRFDIQGTIDVTGTDITITLENNVGNVISGDNGAQSIAEWVVNDGILIVSNDNALGDNATITVNPGAGLRGNIATNQVRTIPNDVTLAGGQLESGFQNSDTYFTGAIDVTADSRIVPNTNDNDDREIHLIGSLTESGLGGDLTIDSGTTVLTSSLDLTGFTGDFILDKSLTRNTVLQIQDGIDVTQDVVVVDGPGLKEIHVTTGNSATISGNITINDTTAESFDLLVQDASDTLTVSGDISGTGGAGLTKTLPGSLILSGQNSYAGNSVIYNGIVTLTSSSRTTIYPTVDATSNQIDVRGAGVVNADGELYFDLSAADATAGNSWQIITGAGTVTPGGTFTVNSSLGAFSNAGSEWTLDDGSNLWTFDLLTGALSVATAGTPFDTWMAQFTTLSGPDTDPGADPDGDNVDNFTEFAFDGNPEDGSNNGRIHLFTEDTVPNDVLVLTVAVRSDTGAWSGSDALTASSAPDGVDYTIEGSLDLLAFDQVISEVSPVQDAGLAPLSAGYKWQSFKLNGSEGLSGKGFMRAAAAEVAE